MTKDDLIVFVADTDLLYDPLLLWLGIISVICIAIVNLPLLWMIKKEKKPTLINQLVGLDCFLSICRIPILYGILTQNGTFMSSSLCGLRVGYSHLMTMLNSLLPVGIVLYRYVYVCKSNWVLTAYQRKSFNIFLSTLAVGFSLFISSCSVIYREKYVHYIACTGQTHTLTHDQGVAWLLPLGHFQKLFKESKRNILCNSGCNGKSVEDLDKKNGENGLNWKIRWNWWIWWNKWDW